MNKKSELGITEVRKEMINSQRVAVILDIIMSFTTGFGLENLLSHKPAGSSDERNKPVIRVEDFRNSMDLAEIEDQIQHQCPSGCGNYILLLRLVAESIVLFESAAVSTVTTTYYYADLMWRLANAKQAVMEELEKDVQGELRRLIGHGETGEKTTSIVYRHIYRHLLTPDSRATREASPKHFETFRLFCVRTCSSGKTIEILFKDLDISLLALLPSKGRSATRTRYVIK